MAATESLAPAADSPTWVKIIDQQRCIGCHACSVACKAENDVPLGVHRTFVKEVEVGRFPNVARSFQVTRCNQCEDAPCTSVCPTRAMYRRPDGIVDFDRGHLHRLQGLSERLPLRRDLHRSGIAERGEM